jgi:hypothetical protein
MRLTAALAICAMGCGGNASPTDAPTSDGASDGPSDPAYSAFAIIGGLDRLRITKTVGGTCFAIQLVSPPTAGNGGLTLPTNWGFESASAMQPGLACDPRYLGPISNVFEATAQSGTITWQGNNLPQSVQSVQVTLTFGGNPPWCPPSEVASAMNVPVQ